jgi:hypothetical protein
VLLEGEAVLNRANARMTLLEDDGDCLAFQRVLAQACDSHIKTDLEAINVEEKGSGVFS